jgi:hypothetical protein
MGLVFAYECGRFQAPSAKKRSVMLLEVERVGREQLRRAFEA